jgi:hypothetical protein
MSGMPSAFAACLAGRAGCDEPSGAFTAGNLQKTGCERIPLEDDSLGGYRLYKIDISSLTE